MKKPIVLLKSLAPQVLATLVALACLVGVVGATDVRAQVLLGAIASLIVMVDLQLLQDHTES